MTPTKFGIPCIISRKPVTVGTSNLVYGFDLELPTRMKYTISERQRGLGHVTIRKFGMPWNICPKSVKIETPNLVHSFVFALPTRLVYNISERGVA